MKIYFNTINVYSKAYGMKYQQNGVNTKSDHLISQAVLIENPMPPTQIRKVSQIIIFHNENKTSRKFPIFSIKTHKLFQLNDIIVNTIIYSQTCTVQISRVGFPTVLICEIQMVTLYEEGRKVLTAREERAIIHLSDANRKQG